MSERSNRATVRNPVLALPGVAKLQALPRPAREALEAVLREIADDAAARAEQCWRKHKAPMAAYWKAVAVYARHTARAITPPPIHVRTRQVYRCAGAHCPGYSYPASRRPHPASCVTGQESRPC